MAWPATAVFEDEVIPLADARVGKVAPVTAAVATSELTDAIEDLGSLYMGAVSMDDAHLEEALRRILFAIRFAWHLPARLEGRLSRPGVPPGLSPLETALLKIIDDVDGVVDDRMPTPEAVLSLLDSAAAELIAIDKIASPDLRNGDFSYPSLSQIHSPDLRDFLALQVFRVRLAHHLASGMQAQREPRLR